ncbi:MAG: cupredoxin domain-containing protein [Patescibacteria group bacterium]
MKATIISVTIAVVLVGGAILFVNTAPKREVAPINNVSIVDGKQIIEIKAKGGYVPRSSVAQAGLPTIVRFNTKGTFDCSSSIRIPSLGISKILPQSGSTDIDLGSPKLGTLLGSCGMGMYPFEIEFKS